MRMEGTNEQKGMLQDRLFRFAVRIIHASELVAERQLTPILQESDELIAMTVASIKTAKARKSNDA